MATWGTSLWGTGVWGDDGPPPEPGDLILLDASVDLLVLSAESQSPIVETDGMVLLDASVEMTVRHQLTPAAPPLGVLNEWPVTRNGHVMPALNDAHPRARVGVDGYVIDRDGVAFRHHVFVDGQDVTYLRDSPLRFDNVTSAVQVGPLTASLAVPQMRPWDVPGDGDLTMFDEDRDPRVEIVRVREDDTVEPVFEGALARSEDASGQGREDYTFNAEGALMQAAHEMHEPPPFQTPIDPGWLVADILNTVTNQRYMKVLRFTTGLPKIIDRGNQGQSKWQRVQDILSKCIDEDGRQLRIYRRGPWDFQLAWKKPLEDVDWTFTKGAPGVEVSITRDQSTRRDAIYGRGVDPDGGVWGNYFFLGLEKFLPPRYPMNNPALNLDGRSDATTDTGNGITTWQRKMRDLGYRVTVDGVMNGADVKWVRQIQRAAGITVDGSLGPQTWAATFDPGETVPDFTVIRQPLAEVTRTRLFNRTASGAKAGRNPDADRTLVRHSMPEVDFGSNIWKRDAIVLAQKMLARDSEPAYVVEFNLTTDPHEPGSSRFDIQEGDNVRLLGHHGDDGIVVQVAERGHDDVTVRLTADSKARDMLALEAILERDRDARRDISSRGGATTDMSSLNKSEVVQFESESKAGFFPRTAINGGLWTVLPIFVSQLGVAKMEFKATSPKAEIAVRIYGKPITANRCAAFEPNPLGSDEGIYDNAEELMDRAGLMIAVGSSGNPGGYWPKPKSQGGALTGVLRDFAGAPYQSRYGGFVWVAVYTDRSTWVEGRVFPASGR